MELCDCGHAGMVHLDGWDCKFCDCTDFRSELNHD